MSNNIVLAICQALAQQSIATLRFNFRGVGGSGGKYGGGIKEQEDVIAALALISLTPDIETARVGLAGYSFGAFVAVPIAIENKKVSLMALVSPALSDSGWEQLKTYPKPVFIISGEYDSFIPPERLQQYIKDTPELRKCEVISGADHFWQGYETEVAEKVAEFFTDGFKPGLI